MTAWTKRKKDKPHFEKCPLCERIMADVNNPKKNSPVEWGDYFCIRCMLILGDAMKQWRLKHRLVDRK
jgi:hypothetical protein